MNVIIPKLLVKRIKLFLISNILGCSLLISYISVFIIIFITHDAKIANLNLYLGCSAFSDNLSTQLSKINYRNFSNLYDFLNNDFYNIFFLRPDPAVFLLGSLRIIQYQYELPSFCSQNFNLARYSAECNPYFSQTLSTFSKKTIKQPIYSSYCVQKACSEFLFNNAAHVIASSKWNANFPMAAFTVDINTKNESLFLLDMQKLQKNGWIDENDTRVLIIDFNVIENIYKTIFKYELILEKPEGEGNQNILLTTKKYMINYYYEEDIVMAFLIPMYTGTTVLYFLKTIFQYSYTQNFALCIDFIMVILDFNFLISYITEFSEFRTIFEKDLNSFYVDKTKLKHKFYNLASLKIYSQYRLIMVFFESLLLSFRIFQFIGIYASFSGYGSFVNAIFRSLTAFLKTMFCLGIILIGWSMGVFLMLGDIDINFETFTNTLLGLFTLDFSALKQSNFFEKIKTFEQDSIYYFVWIVFFTLKLTVIGYFFSIIRFSIKIANKIEYRTADIKEDQIIDCVNQITKKIDKFSKNYLNNLEGEMLTSNKKIVIWLDNNLLSENQSQQLISLTNRLDIHLIPFYEPQQILDFMQFLFRLKPNLMYKSDNLFRICIENKEKKEDMIWNYDIHFTELILDWLKFVGCRVPVCFFMKEKVHTNDLIIIKKKYQNIIMTSSFEDLISFCSLKPFAHLPRKNFVVTETSINSESEESRLMGRNEE